MTFPATAVGWALAVIGVAGLAAGAALGAASVRRFATDGRGTLAPGDPPRELVVRGVYGHVRNPMISGVILVLLGEAAALRSAPHFEWAAGFALFNALYIPLMEERELRVRFGAEYTTYARNVRGLIPRWRAWRPDAERDVAGAGGDAGGRVP